MQFKTSSSPYFHRDSQDSPHNVAILMHRVLYALIPGIATYVWFFGWGIVINLILASLTALICEAFLLKLRHYPLRPFLTDGSALVTAWLLASALSPLVPWWVVVIGSAFAIIFVKHLYGGLGNNLFNPAVAGYAVLLISFPSEMSHWPGLSSLGGFYPSFIDSLNLSFTGHTLGGLAVDAVSSATPLDIVRTELKQFYTLGEIWKSPLFGYLGARGNEIIAGIFLLGGLWLIYTKVITWHIPVAVLGGLFMCAGLFYLIDSDIYPSPLFHMFTGGAVIGAFFIATDPVTAATSLQGRLIYGIGIGLLIYIIRTWGSYPDSIAFAVLLMNMVAPLIDYYTQPRVFGY